MSKPSKPVQPLAAQRVRRTLALRWLVAGVCFVGGAGEANAWKCNLVGDPNKAEVSSLYWADRKIPYVFNAAGTYQLPQDVAFNTIRQAFNNWQSSTLRAGEPAGCPNHLGDTNYTSTDLQFVEGPLTDQDFAGYSLLNPNINRNVVMFRDHAWAYPLTGGESADYMAMTTVTFNKLSGEILDADIELNSFGYQFTVDDDAPIYDLLGVAMHEVGHFLGFGHSSDANATMFPTAGYGELTKRELACDDAAGLWFRFPTGADAQTCARGVLQASCGMCSPSVPLKRMPQATIRRVHDGYGGCQCQSAQSAEAVGLAAAGLVVRRARRDRRRRALR